MNFWFSWRLANATVSQNQMRTKLSVAMVYKYSLHSVIWVIGALWHGWRFFRHTSNKILPFSHTKTFPQPQFVSKRLPVSGHTVKMSHAVNFPNRPKLCINFNPVNVRTTSQKCKCFAPPPYMNRSFCMENFKSKLSLNSELLNCSRMVAVCQFQMVTWNSGELLCDASNSPEQL